MKHLIELYELLDGNDASGEGVVDYLTTYVSGGASVTTSVVAGDEGSTDFVKVVIPGTKGRSSGGTARTLGVIGRLGGLGARPEVKGFVSDGDGALTVLSAAAKLLSMHGRGDVLEGDVILTTHVCPRAPIRPHEPVAFMGSPVEMATMNRYEVDEAMEGILSVDTTKGNNVVNHKGFAISPTVKEGYILRVSPDLLRIYSWVAGIPPVTFPVTTQDITPYGNGVHHINSILQPAVATSRPVVGIAITTVTPVPGSGTGATHLSELDAVVRYLIEVAKEFTAGSTDLYDESEFGRLTELYGSFTILQTLGRSVAQ